MAEVIDEGFREALRRDPKQQRRWVVLVDGQTQQLHVAGRIDIVRSTRIGIVRILGETRDGIVIRDRKCRSLGKRQLRTNSQRRRNS